MQAKSEGDLLPMFTIVPFTGSSNGVNCRTISIGPNTFTSYMLFISEISVSKAADSITVMVRKFCEFQGPVFYEATHTRSPKGTMSIYPTNYVGLWPILETHALLTSTFSFPPVRSLIISFAAAIDAGWVTSSSSTSIPLADRFSSFCADLAVAKTRYPRES